MGEAEKWPSVGAMNLKGLCPNALVRHGGSETNAANIFTGRSNPPLTSRGNAEATCIGRTLVAAGIVPRRVFLSTLHRSADAARLIGTVLAEPMGPIVAEAALDERDYGDLTGLNKAAAAERFSTAQVRQWRRSYAVGPPGGETLRDRVLAFYSQNDPSVRDAGWRDGDRLAREHAVRAIDAFIADLALALGAEHIKSGAPCQCERLAE